MDIRMAKPGKNPRLATKFSLRVFVELRKASKEELLLNIEFL